MIMAKEQVKYITVKDDDTINSQLVAAAFVDGFKIINITPTNNAVHYILLKEAVTPSFAERKN